MSYIVAIRKPFYPEIHVFDSAGEANKFARGYIAEQREGGVDDPETVYLAEVTKITEIQSK